MSTQVTQVAVYLLTAYAAAVVVLTRLRMRERAGGGGAARLQIARVPARVHTAAGAAALLTWVVFLVLGEQLGEGLASLVGIVALLLWWVVALAGVLLLVRWLPPRGKHASAGTDDSWSRGPGLSLLGHVGVLVGVLVFTWAYLISAV